MPDRTDPENEICKSCPYARWVHADYYGNEEYNDPLLVLDCDPPMGECPAEFPQLAE